VSIKVEYISKVYGEQFALDNISLEVKTGEIVGFLGPNGAGKSTLMKILTCFIPPTSGKAEVNGFDVMDDSLNVRKSVGYLPEHNPL
jgi:ABC-2 type transport system ATP-binding protein